MPETGEGTRTKKKGGRTTPERGRYGGFCLSTPLHAPGSSSTYTAVYGHSSTCHTAARTCVGIALVPVSCKHVHQHNICSYPRYGAEISIFCDSPTSRGGSDPSPGAPLDAPRSPKWSSEPVLSPSAQRAAVRGGRGATARPRGAKWSSGVAAVFWAYYNKIFSKIQMTTVNTTSQAYYILRISSAQRRPEVVA